MYNTVRYARKLTQEEIAAPYTEVRKLFTLEFTDVQPLLIEEVAKKSSINVDKLQTVEMEDRTALVLTEGVHVATLSAPKFLEVGDGSGVEFSIERRLSLVKRGGVQA